VVVIFTRILRLASVVICLITITSFGLFAINQTATASAHQQKVLNGEAPEPRIVGLPNAEGEPTPPPGAHSQSARGVVSHSPQKTSLRTRIDDASNALTSPFAGVASSSSSEWTERVTRLLLALAVYGFGFGFLARFLRVRV
jgi:hypothetical protein